MKRSVVQLGNKILRNKAKKVNFPLVPADRELIKDLKRICKAKDGVGIASPQVGVSKRIFIIWSKPNKRYPKAPHMQKPLVIINPKVLDVSKQMISDWEGCLSIPGIRAKVSRHKSLGVEFQNEEGEVVEDSFSGFVARIFQHEFDHLEGILFIDRVKTTELYGEDEFREIIKRKNRL